MPFIQGTKPALILDKDELLDMAIALHKAGYTRHDGPRWTRENEIVTYRKRYEEIGNSVSMQNHVQVVVVGGTRNLHVFAHTEPAGYGIRHLLSAVTDRANFGEGERMLKADFPRR